MTLEAGGAAVGAPVPPPALFAVGILVGFLLNVWIPLPLPIPILAARVSGGVLLLGGFALGLGAMRVLAEAETSPVPHRPSRALVARGAYGISRNPIYLGMALLLTGVAVLARSGWHLVMLVLFVIAIDRLQIRREERYLEAKFGDDFRAYRSRVRRWI
ncbi:MAG TPA: isoprenylcysteine carboxylmethyltransferase family protein [Thermoanaerobaculia bacterium]|nr:isoprenylcysteine carboxylmethyltransferase family protein [Thermoanaerobaculia bacterium]